MENTPDKKKPAEEAPPPALNPRLILRKAKAHWRVGVIVMVVGFGATYGVIATRKPIYQSETTIFYREGIQRNYIGQEGADPLRTLAARLRETLMARANLAPIIQEFGLYPDRMKRGGEVEAADEFRSHIQFRPRSTDTFTISFNSTTREEAQAVTARLADSLVEGTNKDRRMQVTIAAKFLEEERKRNEEDLHTKETELAQFLADHPEFARETTAGGASIREEQRRKAGETDRALEALERQAPRLRARLNPAAAAAVPGAPAVDPALAAAKAQAEAELAGARRQYEEQSARFTEQHPDVQAASRRVKAAEAQVKKAEAAILSPPPPEVLPQGDSKRTEAEAQLKQIEGAIQLRKNALRTKKEGAATPSAMTETVERIVSAETDYSRLTRDVGEAKKRLSAVEAKLDTAKMTETSELGGYTAQIVVLDPAFAPTKSSTMPRSRIAMIGLFLSVVVGIGMAGARGMLLDERIFDPSDVLKLSVPVLVVVPKITPTGRSLRG
jgi:uncharacterized protein involved in exopolysaccharide biosynthesis